MKRNYEGLIVLNTVGKEESVDALVSNLGRDIEAEGAKLEQIDRIGKRKFPYGSKGLSDGYYVNYHFTAEPTVIEKLRNKLKLNEIVHQQHYQSGRPEHVKSTKKAS
jgi:small subunit ribosomal protein S6